MSTVGFYLDTCGVAHKCLTAPNEIHTNHIRSSLLGAALHMGCALSLVLFWHPLKPVSSNCCHALPQLLPTPAWAQTVQCSLGTSSCLGNGTAPQSSGPQWSQLCPSHLSDWDVPLTPPRASHSVRQWAETAIKVSYKFFVTLPTKKWTFLLSHVWTTLVICFTQ